MAIKSNMTRWKDDDNGESVGQVDLTDWTLDSGSALEAVSAALKEIVFNVAAEALECAMEEGLTVFADEDEPLVIKVAFPLDGPRSDCQPTWTFNLEEALSSIAPCHEWATALRRLADKVEHDMFRPSALDMLLAPPKEVN